MKPKASMFFASLFVLLVLTQHTSADVSLPSVFGHHMMLQRGLATPIFGWADPAEKVVVEFGEQRKETTADKTGRWIVRLDPMEASEEGQELVVASSNTIVIKDVLVGDVWICSGQSNMEWSVAASLNPEEEIEAANYPKMRLFNVPGHTTAAIARDKGPGEWKVCSPDSVRNFSAVGYYFGRKLLQETDVPVGLIGTNWGGTRIEPWTPPVGFRNVPELKSIADQVNQFDPSMPQGQATWNRYLSDVADYVKAAEHAMETGGTLPEPVKAPGMTASNQPCAIYNSMVHPLVQYGIRGAIWYQGESNGNEGVEYYHKMRALIEGWRSVWDQGEFPIYFYYVHLANWQAANDNPAGGDGWSRVREAQRKALEIPNTGMAVTLDIGEAGDIHPKNKQDVGARLALWGLRDVHKQMVVPSGPLYKSMEVEENKIRIHFDHVGSGLMVGEKNGLEPTEMVEDGELVRFAIAGENKEWHWAEAEIDGNTVIVWSESVAVPVAVRYGFSMNPAGVNLYNKEGLPASSFRTDDW